MLSIPSTIVIYNYFLPAICTRIALRPEIMLFNLALNFSKKRIMFIIPVAS
ncbi:hypothetical protein CBL13_02887 [Pseudomonas putida]|nr:hypothetical protein CBL13_02887 [Pseudomonas putida]